jgi:hypothetical protein
LNGGMLAPNNTFFNLNDSVTLNGFIQTVTVQYAETKLPSATARVWIYGIVPILGGYIGCSKYLIPSTQISTSEPIQTYTIPNGTINVLNGTLIGIGIQDTSAYLAASSNRVALSVGMADLSGSMLTNASLYFSPYFPQYGIKISYKVIT